jgi:hypothetical protein
MLFTNKSYSNIINNWPYNSVFIRNTSHLHSTSIITDTINWTTIEGSFIADSTYKYLIIGNFYDDEHTSTSSFSGIAYYYIDEVCVSTDSTTCTIPSGLQENKYNNSLISIYPNPSTNELTIDSRLNQIVFLELYDMTGTKRTTATIYYSINTLDLSGLVSGLYFYKIVDLKGNKIKTDKLIITK